ncbi:hypothetical protein HS088_TW15G00213 [Tripterygium wilfordii]|uniref:Zinc finger protein n=1 Tax=Tripterygium wilfordii TaxID=458696 RepID=A0A7J7CL25_TRIWF|nr:hypothetical protein HS088_TW15G00213 [Tripterygium wilfordii]
MGGSTPKCPPDKEEDSDAPLQFLAFYHKAIREELLSLHGLAVTALESGSPSPETVRQLDRRFKFLELAEKYHSAAEDEVLFLALDHHIKNVVCKYSLEHKSIDGLFGSVFGCLNALMDGSDNVIKLFQELVICISTLRTSIDEHMVKEEQQIFSLFTQQFTFKEQVSLVWKFVCSIPVIVLEDLLPWMISFFSPEERIKVRHCMREIVPKNKFLQEVVISWLDKNHGSSSEVYTMSGNVDTDGPVNIKKILRQCTFERSSGKSHKWNEVHSIQTDVKHDPLDICHHWHIAICKDLKEILGELYQVVNLSSFLNLGSLVVRLKFLADVLVYYSNALKRLFYPLSNELANGQLSIDGRIESLQYLLHTKTNNSLPLSKFVEMLCQELKKFVKGVSKLFTFLENKVLPIICSNCSCDNQLQLLYRSLHVMPLGLLKYVITWFSSHLSVDKSTSIIHTINQGDFLVHEAFSSLLLEWFHIGYTGKTSTENFTKDLQKMFKSTCSFSCEQIKEEAGSSSSHLYIHPCRGSNSSLVEPLAADEGKISLSSLSSSSHTVHPYEMAYSSRIHLHIFFPGTLGILQSCMKSSNGTRSRPSIVKEPTPIDLIFIFHKALKKYLQYFVSGSGKLAENDGFLAEFHKNFHLTRYLYQLHSDAEDEIAFPALEAKVDLQNISQSYTIEHKLEVEYFTKVSLILDEISDWQALNSDVDLSSIDKRMVKHHQLCLKLQEMCESMCKLLTDHLHHEETELWPLFREHFSAEEQEKIIGRMLGRTRAEILRDLIPWLMASLTPEEQHAMMFLYRKITRNTMFDEWLAEWWDGYGTAKVAREANISPSDTKDPLEIISTYLSKVFDEKGGILCGEGFDSTQEDCSGAKTELLGKFSFDDKKEEHDGHLSCNESSECAELFNEDERCKEVASATSQTEKPTQPSLRTQKSGHHECIQTMSQYDVEAAIRRVSRDTSLDPQEKSYMIQNLLTSRWIVRQQLSHPEQNGSSNGEEIRGQCPSYRDSLRATFGCQHYKRNCKLVTACCNQLYTCIRCHDEVADHLVDRKSVTKMMCMECLIIQPIGPKCSTASCNSLSMARYYCRICKLFDDDREIYHCPYCNLCRVGKGLGIDYFHCMKCNACMSRSLSVHICIEKCLEDNCPICHEYIFTSSSPVKALPCGHLMHSACFQVHRL